MKTINIVTVLIVAAFISTAAQESCLDPSRLIALDAEWEKALLQSDAKRLESLLAEDFIWVHNHASSTDSKASLIARASDPNVGASGHPISRTSSDVRVVVMGSTGIVTGFTVVDRGATATTYNFMRTYAEIEGKCLLLANHTMAIPEAEDLRSGSVEELKNEAWQMEELYWRYVQQIDTVAYKNLWHDEFIGYPSFGDGVSDKSKIGAWIPELHADPTLKFTYKLYKKTVNAIDDVFIVFYDADEIWTDKDGNVARKETLKFTHTWKKYGDTWLILGGMADRKE